MPPPRIQTRKECPNPARRRRYGTGKRVDLCVHTPCRNGRASSPFRKAWGRRDEVVANRGNPSPHASTSTVRPSRGARLGVAGGTKPQRRVKRSLAANVFHRPSCLGGKDQERKTERRRKAGKQEIYTQARAGKRHRMKRKTRAERRARRGKKTATEVRKRCIVHSNIHSC